MASWSFEITEGFVVNEAIGDGVTQIALKISAENSQPEVLVNINSKSIQPISFIVS